MSLATGPPIDGADAQERIGPSEKEAISVVVYRAHLRKTVGIGLGVGTVLFCVNQLGVVIRGDATGLVWVKVAITYVVPFANFQRRHPDRQPPPGRSV